MNSVTTSAAIYQSIELTRKSESGLQTLHDLFSNHAGTTVMTRALSSKISSLGYFLQSVQALLEKLQGNKQRLDDAPVSVQAAVDNLHSRLDTCQKNIEIWIKRVQDMNLDSNQYCSTFKKGARIAFLTDDFVQIGQQATDHEHGMTADVQIIFSWNAAINNSQHGLSETDMPGRAQANSDVDSVRTTLGTRYGEGDSQVIDKRGVNSSAQEPPQTEVLPSHCDNGVDCGTPPEVLWSCDTITGIEDAFLDDEEHGICIYCFNLFPSAPNASDWRYRGLHLVQEHAFGLCNLTRDFTTWQGMERHLVQFHKLDTDYSDVIFTNFERRPTKGNSLYRKFEDTDPEDGARDEAPDPTHRISARVKYILEHLHNSGLNEILRNQECRDHNVLARLWELDGDLACVEEGIIIETDMDLMASRDIFINGLIKSSWIQERLSLQSQSLSNRVKELHKGQKKRYQEKTYVLTSKSRIGEWLLEILSQSVPMQRILRRALAKMGTGIQGTDVDTILELLLVMIIEE